MTGLKQILQAVGICVAALGVMALPSPPLSPKASTNAFNIIAMTGAFVRPGIILVILGLLCLVVGVLLPERWR